jgi:peptidoglycan/xylan/chitin deacetylase (PgdA/CDA1 family)
VRRIYEEGHTIGTHSEDHPTRFGQLPVEKMRHEIDWGISDVCAALGDSKYLAPFFRIKHSRQQSLRTMTLSQQWSANSCCD